MPTPLLAPELLDRLTGLSLVARRVVEGALHGLHRSPARGLSIEFAQHRQYTPGDEIKHLDWKVLAKSDRYVVRQYEQETNLRALIVVDHSASMNYGSAGTAAPGDKTHPTPSKDQTKSRYACVLAAALSYLLVHQGDSVGLVLAAEGITRQVDPRATPGQVLTICHALESDAPAGRTDLASALSSLASGLSRRSLVIVISDLFDDPEKLINALGQVYHAGHEVIVFHVLDPREMDFELGSAGRGITVLRDMETREEFEAEPALIGDLVRAEVNKFLARIDQGCRSHNIHLIRCATHQPHDRVLTRYLTYRAHAKNG